jgi:hypothetical protein
VIDVPPEEVARFLRYLFAGSLIYTIAIAFVKFTILAFYWRLFSMKARIPITILTLTVFIWLVSLVSPIPHAFYTVRYKSDFDKFLLALLACSPIRAQFDPSITTAKCIDTSGVYLGGSLINVIVDFVLVVMPLPYVWRLNASLGQRIVFGGIFALGIFTSIVSIIRLTIVRAIPSGDEDTPYNLRNFILWSIVEINIGLTCACLPSMRPLLRLLRPARLFATPRSARKDPGPLGLEPPQNKRSRAWHPHPRSPISALFSNIVNTTKVDSQENILLTGDHFVGKTATNITAASTVHTTDARETIEARGGGLENG